jgi:hypothetical protein
VKIIVLTILLLTLSNLVAAETESVYTSTRENDCQTQSSASEEGASYLGLCPGVTGYTVQLKDDDNRQTLDVITPAGSVSELNFWSLKRGFSQLGDNIEWRLQKGVPVALIVRYRVADKAKPNTYTAYLMIAKIAKTTSCVTDIVPPMAKQNEAARKLADTARARPCLASKE